MNIALSELKQQEYLEKFCGRFNDKKMCCAKYLDFGVTVIRVLCYTDEIFSVMQKQLGYVLRDEMDHYDGTIVVWKETEIKTICETWFKSLSFQQKLKVRAEMLWLRAKVPVINSVNADGLSICKVDGVLETVEVFDVKNNTVYYGVGNFEPEIFVKHGHCFVQIINKLIKSENVNLTHGAVFGYNGQGFLLCGRGKRGKSTLTVQCMLQGFEYVSDDYQILVEVQQGLFAYPIYSIVTLSYRMYNEMYDYFRGKFLCNNFTQEKYIFNISTYHDQFRSAYPIKFCLFPEIVKDKEPSIRLCSSEEKGRAIVHLIHSTTTQMLELGDVKTICKLFNMVKGLPFYKFNLCNDIVENTNYLKEFLTKECFEHNDLVELPRILGDITFGLATFLDTKEFRFYAMNKFATGVYQLLCSGVSESGIDSMLKKYIEHNSRIIDEYVLFRKIIDQYGFSQGISSVAGGSVFIDELATKSDYHLSVLEYMGLESRELIKVKEN